VDALILDCACMATREINAALAELPDGAGARILAPWGQHNLAVALENRITVAIEGNAGYFIGGLCDGPDVVVDGFVGWSVGENLMSGTVRVRGNASECAGASAHGGTVIVEGDASSRAGISLKGGTVLVGGDVGHMSGFMAQAGVLLVGGNAGHALGDSLYETVIYVGGSIASLGSDARVEDLTDDDVLTVKRLADRAGFDHIDPASVTRVASARQLYNFDALSRQRY
jgi:formylmethanofuran dehydrogenase subunit C